MYDNIKNYDAKHYGSPRGFCRLIDDTLVFLPDNRVVGYCSSLMHPGFITEQLLLQHKCPQRNCPYLHKFEEHPYWQKHQKAISKQLQKHIAQAAKFDPAADAIQKEQKAEQIGRTQQESREQIRDAATLWLKQNDVDDAQFLIVDISALGRSTKYYRIQYVSSEPRDDTGKYRGLVSFVERTTQCVIKLVHITDANGYFATVEEYLRRKKWR